MACEPQLRAAEKTTRLGGETKIWNCDSEKRSVILNSAFPNKAETAILQTTTGEARALSYPGSPTTFKTLTEAN
jgi:hypothetical protein